MNGQKPFWVYIVASGKNGTIYIGHTDDLPRRITEHRDTTFRGFTSKYGCTRLVWREAFDTREEAFLRERQLKDWRRAWKIQLIEQDNPDWRDLWDALNI